MSGNLAKTHIFTLLHPTNLMSHLGRSQFFLGSMFSILQSLFYNFVPTHLQKEKENIPLKVSELPQVTLFPKPYVILTTITFSVHVLNAYLFYFIIKAHSHRLMTGNKRRLPSHEIVFTRKHRPCGNNQRFRKPNSRLRDGCSQPQTRRRLSGYMDACARVGCVSGWVMGVDKNPSSQHKKTTRVEMRQGR